MKVGEFCFTGLYDPGANASAISYIAFKRLKNCPFIPDDSFYNTPSGKGCSKGITMLDVSILATSKRVLLHILDAPNLKYDFIIGLDLIPSFGLALDHKLELTQHLSGINVNKQSSIAIHNIWNDYMTEESFHLKTSHLNVDRKSVIRNLIEKNNSAFAKNAFDVGNVTKYECPINLEKDIYVSKKPYRCTYEDQEEIERQCKALLENGMITESTSPFASPVTMQFKKDGLSSTKIKTRMCIDFRLLNKILVPESQPFPLIDEIIPCIRDCEWFSALDINAAFWSIPIRKSDRHKTAFITRHGHYEWRSMPFGLKVSPAVFQRVLSGILKRRNLSNFAVNYLDDILIFSRTFEEHVKHIQLVITAIYEEGFRLNFKKCNFATPTIQYLGHILTSNSVQPLHDNLIAIKSFPVPSSRKQVRQFLGKINFYRKFIPNSISLLEPFHNLLRKNVPFTWSSACQACFDGVKLLLTSAPILAVFDRTKPISIYTDASGVGIGAVLKQKQDDGVEKPVAYFSKKLSPAQIKKGAIYIESIAIREAVRYWRFWLIGRHFKIITDHKPLQNLNLKARPDEELGDLASELLQFDFEVLYRPGSENSEADCLSRNPVLDPSPDTPCIERIIPTLNFLNLGEIATLQNNVNRLESDVLRHGIIFRRIRGTYKIVLDYEAGKRLTHLVHMNYGHIGSKHILSIVSGLFTFPNMYKYVNKYCKLCDTCIRNKSRRPRRSGEMGFLGPATLPYQIMSLDTVGGFAGNNAAAKYLHILVDHFSRYAYVLCSKGQSAKDMISLIDSVHKCHPIGTLLTDQYGGLTSENFKEYCSRSGITHVFTAVDSASSNGLNERLNQTLVNRFRCAKHDENTSPNVSWTAIAKKCVSQYNKTPHSVTKFAPQYLLSGTVDGVVPSCLTNPPDLTADRAVALSNSISNHEYNKRMSDKNKSPITFKIGDLVYVDNGNKLNRQKLDNLRIGPYEIVDRLSNNVFQVKVGHGHFDTRLYHANKLLPVNTIL